MGQLPLWITPALMLGLFAWFRFMFRDLTENINELRTDMNGRFAEMNRRFEHMDQRFDQVNRALADNRERMAKLEGALDGFLAGRRDRDAA